MEPDEGLEKLGDALKICAHFKKLYFEKKSQLSVYFKEQPVVEWNFKSSLIFTRMDMFINQMRLIKVRLHNDLYWIKLPQLHVELLDRVKIYRGMWETDLG